MMVLKFLKCFSGSARPNPEESQHLLKSSCSSERAEPVVIIKYIWCTDASNNMMEQFVVLLTNCSFFVPYFGN